MNTGKAHFDPTWNLGHIIIAVGMLVGWVCGGFVVYVGVVQSLTTLTLKVNGIENVIGTFQVNFQSTRDLSLSNKQNIDVLRSTAADIAQSNSRIIEQLTGLRVDLGRMQGGPSPLRNP